MLEQRRLQLIQIADRADLRRNLTTHDKCLDYGLAHVPVPPGLREKIRDIASRAGAAFLLD